MLEFTADVWLTKHRFKFLDTV